MIYPSSRHMSMSPSRSTLLNVSIVVVLFPALVCGVLVTAYDSSAPFSTVVFASRSGNCYDINSPKWNKVAGAVEVENVSYHWPTPPSRSIWVCSPVVSFVGNSMHVVHKDSCSWFHYMFMIPCSALHSGCISAVGIDEMNVSFNGMYISNREEDHIPCSSPSQRGEIFDSRVVLQPGVNVVDFIVHQCSREDDSFIGGAAAFKLYYRYYLPSVRWVGQLSTVNYTLLDGQNLVIEFQLVSEMLDVLQFPFRVSVVVIEPSLVNASENSPDEEVIVRWELRGVEGVGWMWNISSYRAIFRSSFFDTIQNLPYKVLVRDACSPDKVLGIQHFIISNTRKTAKP